MGGAVSTKTLTNNVSVSANTATGLMGQDPIDSNGVYLVKAQVSFSPNANTAGIVQVAVTSEASGLGNEIRTSWHIASTAQRRLVATGIIHGVNKFYVRIYSTVAGSVDTNTHVAFVRLS